MPVNPDGHDLTWLLAHGADAAYQYAVAVRGCLTDVDAAYAARDWPVCVEACAATLRAVAHCEQVCAGYPEAPSSVEWQLELALGDRPAAAALGDLPVPVGATRADADAARTLATRHAAILAGTLPVTVPVMPGAEGPVPTVRVDADLQRLRATSRLAATEWNRWGL